MELRAFAILEWQNKNCFGAVTVVKSCTTLHFYVSVSSDVMLISLGQTRTNSSPWKLKGISEALDNAGMKLVPKLPEMEILCSRRCSAPKPSFSTFQAVSLAVSCAFSRASRLPPELSPARESSISHPPILGWGFSARTVQGNKHHIPNMHRCFPV